MSQKWAVYSTKEQIGNDVDLDAAGNIDIGATNATSVDIGRVGVTSNLKGNYAAGQLPATGVVPGSYTNVNATVDASGRLTSISNGAAPTSTGSKPTASDKFLTPAASSGADDFDTGLTLGVTPDPGSYISVRVNGVPVARVAEDDTERTTSLFYFGAAGGTADPMNGLTSGSKLFFNPTVAGYDLVITDTIDLNYDENHTTPSVPALVDKFLTPLASAGVDQFDTGLTLTNAPSASSYVGVRVNGVYYRVAQSEAERLTSEFYFGPASPADNMATLAGGEALRFNPTVAGFDLVITDKLDLDYNEDLGAITTVPSLLNKYEAPLASSGADDFDTGLVLYAGPVANGYVGVRLNGVHYRVAQSNAERATSEFYYGTTPGTALAMASLALGNKLFFNPTVAGFDLAITDTVDQDYNSVPAAPVAAVVATLNDKFLTPLASVGVDDFDTGLTVTGLPVANSFIGVFVNGLRSVRTAQSNAERAASMFYFGLVPGTAVPMATVTTGHKLFFNPTVAGFDLAITDRLDIDYLS